MGTSVPPPFSQILAGIEIKLFLLKSFRLLIDPPPEFPTSYGPSVQCGGSTI